MIFKNQWYQFNLDEQGEVLITSASGDVILQGFNYHASYGKYANACEPLKSGSKNLLVDETDIFNEGDTIAIRSEIGKMNNPVSHSAVIQKIDNNRIYFSPAYHYPYRRILKRSSNRYHFQQIIDAYRNIRSLKGVFVEKIVNKINGIGEISISAENDEDSSRYTITGLTPVSKVRLIFSCSVKSPEIEIDVETDYFDDIDILSEWLELNFSVDVSEIYRKNGKLDYTHFQKKYWLDKQGVRFGRGDQTALVYHTPDVSSLSLEPEKKRLTVHLDSMYDHRFRYVKPQTPKRNSLYRELHPAHYKKGQKRKNSFRMNAGYSPPVVPRLLNIPSGYQAVYVWTEHADRTTIETHRAVYFGDEEITDAEKATGGFVKNKIPVTKSVYYSNPDDMEKCNTGEPSVAIKESLEFEKFLTGLYATGDYDICLHSVTPDSAPRSLVEEAIPYMKNKFDSISWIDHDAPRSREDLSSDGLDESSGHYTADLWCKHGTKYFWHYASEDAGSDRLDILQTGKDDRYHTPRYWRHPGLSPDIISWAAIPLTPRRFNGTWSFYHKDKHIAQLIDNWGVCITHTYPALTDRYLGRSSGGWNYNKNKKMVVSKDFERCLQKLAQYRDEGKLLLTTIREILGYWLALENIRVYFNQDDTVLVHNNYTRDIIGLTFAAKASGVLVNDMEPSSKRIADDLIFWFDLPSQESAVLTFKSL